MILSKHWSYAAILGRQNCFVLPEQGLPKSWLRAWTMKTRAEPKHRRSLLLACWFPQAAHGARDATRINCCCEGTISGASCWRKAMFVMAADMARLRLVAPRGHLPLRRNKYASARSVILAENDVGRTAALRLRYSRMPRSDAEVFTHAALRRAPTTTFFALAIVSDLRVLVWWRGFHELPVYVAYPARRHRRRPSSRRSSAPPTIRAISSREVTR